MAKTRHNGPKTELESLSRAPETFSQSWKVSPARRGRFPKAGKSLPRAGDVFPKLESLSRAPETFSQSWKVSPARRRHFPKAGKSLPRAGDVFPKLESLPRKPGKVSRAVLMSFILILLLIPI